MTSRASTYAWQGLVLLRASTLPGAADIPRTLDLDDPVSTRHWLQRVWRRPEAHQALSLASPGLSTAVHTLLADPNRSARTSGGPPCPPLPTSCAGSTGPHPSACSPASPRPRSAHKPAHSGRTNTR